jgi:hypothetical protein
MPDTTSCITSLMATRITDVPLRGTPPHKPKSDAFGFKSKKIYFPITSFIRMALGSQQCDSENNVMTTLAYVISENQTIFCSCKI